MLERIKRRLDLSLDKLFSDFPDQYNLFYEMYEEYTGARRDFSAYCRDTIKNILDPKANLPEDEIQKYCGQKSLVWGLKDSADRIETFFLEQRIYDESNVLFWQEISESWQEYRRTEGSGLKFCLELVQANFDFQRNVICVNDLIDKYEFLKRVYGVETKEERNL